ncbi:MAG: glycosyltransferase family 4 protein [Ardenticatenaceae bacterium]
MSAKIAYIMSRFPKLSETFILREMSELERQGEQVALYPLIVQREAIVHTEAKAWIGRMQKLPFMSPAIFATNSRALIQQPCTYCSSLAKTFWENRTFPKFLTRAMLLFPKAIRLARLMQQDGIAHIHAHYATHPAFVAWLINQMTGITFSLTAHAHDIFVRQEMLATKLRAASFIVAISEYNRDFLARTIGEWVRKKTIVVHCGIRPNRFSADSMPSQRRTRFEIISIGSLQPYKGFPYLIQACDLLRQKGVPFRCRIIGGGEERPGLERMIASSQLNEQVELLGAQPQDEVVRLLRTADCYVQPSIITSEGKMEGIPVALMEALACGLPVVATNISGIPELVRPDETGVLVPPAEASALADGLATIYDNPEQARRLAQNGQRLVQQEYNLRTNTEHLLRLFRQVTKC